MNHYSLENLSDTPDFILAAYLRMCLDAYNETLVMREQWYGRSIGGIDGPAPAGQGPLEEMMP